MRAVVRVQDVVPAEEGAGAHTGRHGAVTAVVEANQLALHNAAHHHLVEMIGVNQVAVQQRHLLFRQRHGVFLRGTEIPRAFSFDRCYRERAALRFARQADGVVPPLQRLNARPKALASA